MLTEGFDTMDYCEAVQYMESECAAGSKYDLSRIEELLQRLGNPEKKLKLVHVAGTNGKGSISRMLQSILTEAGYKTGIFNSPFLGSPREYLCIDGINADEREYAESVERIRNSVEAEPEMQDRPTEFELSFALAADYFFRNNCDIAIIECGLGGLTDATNCIPAPELAIIANIGLDHVKLLGNTLAEIAAQKSGIIKEGSAVVAYPSEKEALDVIINTCRKRKCELIIPDISGTEYELSLKGEFQKRNASVVLAAVKVLRKRGFEIDETAVRSGFANTVWPARFEIMSENPLIIIDGGHNSQCVDAFCENLDKMKIKNAIFIIGVMADKAYREMFIKLKKYVGLAIITEPSNPRRLNCIEGAAVWKELGKETAAAAGPAEAVRLAFSQYKKADYSAIIATGSLYMMDEVRNAIKYHLLNNT